MWLWLLCAAQAAELRPIRAGDTVESLAAGLGDAALAAEIRALNSLAADEQPAVGQLVKLPPPTTGEAIDQNPFLVAASGTVTAAVPGEDAVPARTFVAYPLGSLFCTGSASWATIRIATVCDDGGHDLDDITLDPATCVQVDGAFSSVHGRSTVITVQRGSVRVAAQEGAAGAVTVITSDGVTTGAEGGFRVTVEDDATRTEALYADVAVQGAGTEVALGAGEGSRVIAGQAPSDPVTLLVVSDLVRPLPGEPLRRPAFSWTPDAAALGYRIEIAENRTFTALVHQDDVTDTPHRPTLLQLPFTGAGGLWWRVAPFDALGFLGVPTAPREVTLPMEMSR